MPRIQTLKQLANLRNFSHMFSLDKITQPIVQALLKDGRRIIMEAYKSRRWKNRTGNLRDSYVAAVVSKGRVLGWTYVDQDHADYDERDVISDTHNITTESGRKEAINFVLSYAKQHSKADKIILVVGVAMFYAGILESQGYRVLTNIDVNLQEIAEHGVVLTDFKVGNIFRDFGEGSDAQVKIGRKHIAYRKDVQIESLADRKKSFDTKNTRKK